MPADPTPEPRDPDDVPDGDDADLIAFLDGELPDPEARAVEAKLALDPDARAKADALRKTFDLLDYLPRTEPSPDFATRTLTRLDPVPGSASAERSGVGSRPASSVSSTSSLPVVPSRVRWWAAAAWLAAGLAAGVVGFLGHLAARPYLEPPARDAEDLSLTDLGTIERLPLYLGVDDLDYLRELDRSGLFDGDRAGPRCEPPPVGDRDKLIAEFKAFPPARRQELRQLDQGLLALAPPDKDRLDRVLEGYAVWLDRLPDGDRKRVLAAGGPGERVEEVRRVWEKGWQEGLPARNRDQLRQVTDPRSQVALVEEWKKDQVARRDEWALARRQWDALQQADRKPWPFNDPELAPQVDQFVRDVLKADLAFKPEPKGDLPSAARLTRDEFLELKQRHEAAVRDDRWFLYGRAVYRLADRHPSLPEPVGRPPLVDPSQLPKDFAKEFRVKAILGVFDGSKKVYRGKWPEFALEVADALKKEKDKRPPAELFGPCRPGEFAPAINGFLTADLLPKLTPEEKAELAKLEGQWPEYPQRMLALAKAHDLPVPGVTLPGPPSLWTKYYSLGAPGKDRP